MLEEAGNIATAFDIDPLSMDQEEEEVSETELSSSPTVYQAPVCVTPTHEKPIAHKAQKTLAKKTWKKPADKPKRPLSAYNLFFQHEREKIITNNPEVTLETVLYKIRNTIKPKKRKHRKSHGMIGFAELARTIADKWKTIDEDGRSPYEEKAGEEKAKYKVQLEQWTKMREAKSREEEQLRAARQQQSAAMDLGRVRIVYDEPELPSYYQTEHNPYRSLQERATKSSVTAENIESLIMSNNSLRRRFNHMSQNSDIRDYLRMTEQTIEMARASLSLPLFRNLHIPTHIMPGGGGGHGYASASEHALASSSDFGASIYGAGADAAYFGSRESAAYDFAADDMMLAHNLYRR